MASWPPANLIRRWQEAHQRGRFCSDMQARMQPFSLLASGSSWWRRGAARLLERASGLTQLGVVHELLAQQLGLEQRDPVRWLLAANAWLGVKLDLPAGDLDRVPVRGGGIVVAEHPTGAMEGVLLLALLLRRRPDVKVLANRWLQRLPALVDLVLPIDVYGNGNAAAVRAALRHLRQGGLLLAFPAGEVAHRGLLRRHAIDAPWQAALAGLQRRAEVPVVPVHVAASNPLWFHLAGVVHRHLRTALLPRALLAQRDRRVAVRIGHAVPPGQLARFADDDRARCDYLRLRTEILARREGERMPAIARNATEAPVAPRGSVDAIAAEITRLPAAALLVAGNGMQVFCARAVEIPAVLEEIGRLRECTFRAVGEGSGQQRDLDGFDASYRHLFVWDPAAREIVGSYRLGLSDELLADHGASGLYTSGIYDFAPEFWRRVSPALELGRAFVQARYQKGYAPLLLLWRGIGAFVVRHQRYRLLFGTVSISADHHATSVRLMVDHLQSHCLATELAPFVRSRRPWRAARGERHGVRWQPQQIAQLQDVSAMVRELEVGRLGVPVLLEQYLKLGARLLGVNVDPDFHTIDALVVVDLVRAPKHLLQRYLGEPGASALLHHHDGEASIGA